MGSIAPSCDLWINYSDGFYLDSRALGFASPGAYVHAQHTFYEKLLARGDCARLINTVQAERATLKLWLATLDPERFKTIPSFRLEPRNARSAQQRLMALRARYASLVVKPNWGGASFGVEQLATPQQIAAFAERFIHQARRLHPYDAYCVQPQVRGPEKRLWFVGNRCVDGRIIVRRPMPWDPVGARSKGIERYYFEQPGDRMADDSNRTRPALRRQFEHDLRAAQRIWRRAGLEIGSVDFIGNQVNELNGCGTTFTQYDGWRCVTDARPHLIRWLRALAGGPGCTAPR
jgi:hypothetical protein